MIGEVSPQLTYSVLRKLFSKPPGCDCAPQEFGSCHGTTHFEGSPFNKAWTSMFGDFNRAVTILLVEAVKKPIVIFD